MLPLPRKICNQFFFEQAPSNLMQNLLPQDQCCFPELPEVLQRHHLKNHPPANSQKYLYPHSFLNHFVKQKYTTQIIPQFYRPTNEGKEEGLKKRLEKLWGSSPGLE